MRSHMNGGEKVQETRRGGVQSACTEGEVVAQAEAVPLAVRCCANYDKASEDYYYPTLAEIMKYHVVIVTLVTSANNDSPGPQSIGNDMKEVRNGFILHWMGSDEGRKDEVGLIVREGLQVEEVRRKDGVGLIVREGLQVEEVGRKDGVGLIVREGLQVEEVRRKDGVGLIVREGLQKHRVTYMPLLGWQRRSLDQAICTNSTILVTSGIPAGHFSHVFIDEGGHAVEPEVLVPIAGILTTEGHRGTFAGQLVIAGDPKQLGPIIRSTVANKMGLGRSFLERLMDEVDLYSRDEETDAYDTAVITKLIKNFRSHKDILNISNSLFYHKELKVL
uniref:DNA2/NAM7 helicase helicase domain-containing protein n=1 Tax=Timema genevievae TaxID=629358 RepID=A0A7R9K332_TIMGE|nr:unnamed protein product [Timema genevievae]